MNRGRTRWRSFHSFSLTRSSDTPILSPLERKTKRDHKKHSPCRHQAQHYQKHEHLQHKVQQIHQNGFLLNVWWTWHRRSGEGHLGFARMRFWPSYSLRGGRGVHIANDAQKLASSALNDPHTLVSSLGLSTDYARKSIVALASIDTDGLCPGNMQRELLCVGATPPTPEPHSTMCNLKVAKSKCGMPERQPVPVPVFRRHEIFVYLLRTSWTISTSCSLGATCGTQRELLARDDPRQHGHGIPISTHGDGGAMHSHWTTIFQNF